MRYAFSGCVLDTEARELRRGGERRALSPKAFDLLVLLVGAAPRALSQAELRDRIWPHTHVARTSLARLATEIRKAVGDTGRGPRALRNVHGFGYALDAAVAVEAAAPARAAGPDAPALVWGAREYVLADGENVIGRSPDCQLPIDSTQVSRRHARVFVLDGHATVEDLGSKNGTFLGGRRVLRPTRLEDGDHLVVGPALFVFRGSPRADSTKTGPGR